MVRGVRWYLAGSLILVTLAGCGRGFLQFAERDKWRREAEVACLKSGTVKESVSIVRIEPIEGPGVCGADFPLKVAAFGESGAFGFAQEPIRPPAAVPGVSGPMPRWPVAPARAPTPTVQPPYVPSGAPISLEPPGGGYSVPGPGSYPRDTRAPITSAPLPPRYSSPQYPSPQFVSPTPAQPPAVPRTSAPVLGPLRGPPVIAASTSVQIKPVATLACPMVSALDHWIADAVQPAAQRWFGQPVVEIKQISAYSCRGMNGQPGARISEHAFGNALDIAAFVLADGRRVTIKDGWRGAPEEQGFLRDIQGAACDQFTTVLAPGSNAFHYDHFHVDLMRRASGRRICQPGAVDGELIAAQARRNPALAARRAIPPTRRYDPPFNARNDPFAWRGDARRGDPDITGSIAVRDGGARANPADDDNDWVEDPGPRIRLE
jgi:hypothetical protein